MLCFTDVAPHSSQLIFIPSSYSEYQGILLGAVLAITVTLQFISFADSFSTVFGWDDFTYGTDRCSGFRITL